MLRVRPVGACASQWESQQQPITCACLHASTLALACGTRLYILSLDPGSGKLAETQCQTFPHQIAALALTSVQASVSALPPVPVSCHTPADPKPPVELF